MGGLSRGKCSYKDCSRDAEVGGHIWIKQKGVYIAPICNSCNYHENVSRMRKEDGTHSFLSKDTVVVKTDYTEDMKHAERRVAIAVVRRCVSCESDISDSPEHHVQCMSCYLRRLQIQRKCIDCQTDISDRPGNHTQCLDCYRGNNLGLRRCVDCRKDISDRPENHFQCLDCYRRKNARRRRCVNCQRDISDRPENHFQCYGCY